MAIASCLPSIDFQAYSPEDNRQSLHASCLSAMDKALLKRSQQQQQLSSSSKSKQSSFDRICREFMGCVNQLMLLSNHSSSMTMSSSSSSSSSPTVADLESLLISCGLTCLMEHVMHCAHVEARHEFPVTGAVVHARHIKLAVSPNLAYYNTHFFSTTDLTEFEYPPPPPSLSHTH
jgi:hypothetical protein